MDIISNINLRFPFAALILLIIIGVVTIRKRRIPLRSMKLFTQLYTIMTFNILAEIGTLVCLYNLESVPPVVTDIVHIIFILSLCLMTWRFFMYILHTSASRSELKIPILLLTTTPMLVAVIACVFGKIYYYTDGFFVYSYGSMPSSIYVCIALYMLSGIICAILHRNRIAPHRLKNIFFAVGIWIICAIIQLVEPRILISSIGGAALLYFMSLSLENPDEFFNSETLTFNKRAFIVLTNELLDNKKKFYVVTLLAPGLTTIKTSF